MYLQATLFLPVKLILPNHKKPGRARLEHHSALLYKTFLIKDACTESILAPVYRHRSLKLPDVVRFNITQEEHQWKEDFGEESMMSTGLLGKN